jgi:hypothetical protein
MKRLSWMIALLFTSSAFAQPAPSKPAKRPPVQLKPQAPMGCRLVGTVKGTKIWAGDCIAPEPAAEAPQPAPPPATSMPPMEKQ